MFARRTTVIVLCSVAVLAAVGIVLWLVLRPTPPSADPEALREQTGLMALREPAEVVDFTLESLAGTKVSLSSFRGKVVLLNFWATWCPPCRAEIPAMVALYQKLNGLGLEILAVDLQEDRATVASFAESNGMTFSVLLDATGEVGSTYGASAIPTTYVVDRRGVAVSGIQGSLEWGTPAVEAYLRALLSSSP